MKARLIGLAAVIGLLCNWPASGSAASYSFTKIADTRGDFSDVQGFPSINNQGVVVFSAIRPIQGIFPVVAGQSLL